jgi:hypothetical protein
MAMTAESPSARKAAMAVPMPSEAAPTSAGPARAAPVAIAPRVSAVPVMGIIGPAVVAITESITKAVSIAIVRHGIREPTVTKSGVGVAIKAIVVGWRGSIAIAIHRPLAISCTS